MKKSWKNLWGRFLFRDRGILPGGRLLVVFLAFSAVVTLLFTFSSLTWVWVFSLNGTFLLVSLLDLFYSPKKSQLIYTREIPNEMERGISYTVEITLQNVSLSAANFQFKDDLPQTFHTNLPLNGYVAGEDSVTFSYDVTAPIRGKYDVEKLFIRYRSVLGLWKKQTVARLADTVKVIPDLTETKQYLTNAQKFLLYEGQKIRRQRGGDGEFSQIRSYVVGDDPRKINWRQTAKSQEVMTNEYEPEHGKYITILIDCGRMMGAELEKGNRLEKALEAAITVAAAALKNDDYVAVLAFAKNVNVYVPPAKGMDHLQKILQSVYALEVEPSESNYPVVMWYVETMQKKRSLILLFSDIHTFLQEESALLYLKRLRQRHLFLMIGVEDEALQGYTKQDPANVKKAMIKSMAQEQISFKKREKAKWERQGLLMVEAKEEHLTTTAVSHYIQIMNQGLL